MDCLYIEADEDHVSIQFREKKGELKENEKFWDEVYESITENYDLSSVKKIYVSGDGG